MKLLFERSVPGRKSALLPQCDVPAYELPSGMTRQSAPRLPELSEQDVSRHYTELERNAFGVNRGFYPLGSCTMKYNPHVDEEAAALEGFTRIHPLQAEADTAGCREVMELTKEYLCQITGMDGATLQPAAGAHGEFMGLLLIKAYHDARGDKARTKIIVPDSAHGTNPASASMAGYTIVNIPSGPDGLVDLHALEDALGPDVAGFMLTNPNTVGLFEKNILKITSLVHSCGALCYNDGANLNAIMGATRPGDMGFDVMHVNLHKTFATPHGGGGPGSGPVCCKKALLPYLPDDSLGGQGLRVKANHGNFLVIVKALAYMMTLGAEGIRSAAQNAVLNANYLRVLLSKAYTPAFDCLCKHEFVLTLEKLKEETGVSALDMAKGMIDLGMHPPTMYFPLIVHEALMFEPTETESKETLDAAAEAILSLSEKAYADPESLRTAPHNAVISRPDEVKAARNPLVRYGF